MHGYKNAFFETRPMRVRFIMHELSARRARIFEYIIYIIFLLYHARPSTSVPCAYMNEVWLAKSLKWSGGKPIWFPQWFGSLCPLWSIQDTSKSYPRKKARSFIVSYSLRGGQQGRMERVPNKAPFLLLFSGKAEADAGRPNHTFVSAQNHPSVHTHRPHNSII